LVVRDLCQSDARRRHSDLARRAGVIGKLIEPFHVAHLFDGVFAVQRWVEAVEYAYGPKSAELQHLLMLQQRALVFALVF